MNIGDEVKVTTKYSGAGATWVVEMDGLLGKTGKIVNKVRVVGTQRYRFQVKIAGSIQDFWFSKECLTLTKERSQWFISDASNTPYILIGTGIDKSYFEDANGEIFSNQEMSFSPAPVECNSFDWRFPPKSILID